MNNENNENKAGNRAIAAMMAGGGGYKEWMQRDLPASPAKVPEPDFQHIAGVAGISVADCRRIMGRE